jgi:hypothetical protein
MEIQLSPSLVLTTDRAESRGGIPVLVNRADASRAYGPTDLILVFCEPTREAAYWVHQLAKKAQLTDAERQAVKNYLAQWPKGPQLD